MQRSFVWTAGVASLALLAGASAVWIPDQEPRAAQPPAPQAFRDLAVTCLALGQVTPPVAEMSDPHLDAVVGLLGRLMHSYGQADFQSFLALRASDLEHAGDAGAVPIEVLRELGRELELDERDLDGDWLDVLESFWSAYYRDGPPVLKFLPEGTSVELHTEGLLGRTTQDWERTLDAVRDRVRGPWIEHHLVIPHRRSLARVAADVGPLSWVDVELAFESPRATPGRLVARFVWDGVESEWFLQRAVTVFRDGQRGGERQLIL